MFVAALVLTMAAQSLDAFDDSNLTLTSCGFAAFRDSNERGDTLAQFSRSLPSRCSQQIADLRAAIIAVERHRGKSGAAAAASAEAMIAQFTAQFAADYAKRAETEAQVRVLERALREEGKSNAD